MSGLFARSFLVILSLAVGATAAIPPLSQAAASSGAAMVRAEVRNGTLLKTHGVITA